MKLPRSGITVLVGCLFGMLGGHCPGQEVGNDGGLVGGACRDHRDCAERCVEGGDFPSGTCTVDCRDDRDCPDFTFCVDEKGGVCLLACDFDDECRGRYDCKSISREGADGNIDVCIH
jgi:hypothetical protein